MFDITLSAAELFLIIALAFITIFIVVASSVRQRRAIEHNIESTIQRELGDNNRLNQQATELIGSQLNQRISEQTDSLGSRISTQTDSLDTRVTEQTKALNERLTEHTSQTNERLAEQNKATNQQLIAQNEALNKELARNREELSRELKQVREIMEVRIKELQQENSKKLDEMRATVDEKLSETLEKRFSESFTLISDRLESVQRGLGEMQQLAGNVTDLKNILANVKTRGNFGEYQLKALLEEVFTPDQYEANFAPKPRSQQRVEFAIRMPGRAEEAVFLPIDSKFPLEDYQRLLDAYEQGGSEVIAEQRRLLLARTRRFALDIRDKYINPPRTTDFAVMFVPTEGLYAELLREPGFADNLLRNHKVLLAGPTTFIALVSSLQVGFSTLAIEKRSSEVWKLLSSVKTEFATFQSILERVDKRLEQARSEISTATRKTSTIQSKLKDVAELPAAESALLLEGEIDDALDKDYGVDADDVLVVEVEVEDC
ncbi:MAG: DNA recombination protein RmuC [Coriobacteriia bacterium]|nr:DNA recombination protein RmuC [Coriobacteriia bacterium]